MQEHVRDGSRGCAPASDISGSGMQSRGLLPRREFQPRSPAGCCCWSQWGSLLPFGLLPFQPFHSGTGLRVEREQAVFLSVKTRGEQRQTPKAESKVTNVTSGGQWRGHGPVGYPPT